MRLFASVHLHEHRQLALLGGHFFRQGRCDLLPVDRFDHIEQRDRILCLVGLQRTDEMKLDVRVEGAKRWPLGLGFLDAVLAEHAVAKIKRRLDRLGIERFRNRRELDIFMRSACLLRRFGDGSLDKLKVADRINGVHAPPVAEFCDRVIALSEAAWRMREAATKPCDLPFALALFTDPDRLPSILGLVEALPKTVQPLAVIFRHDRLGEERIPLAREVRQITQERGHQFLMARAELDGADGTHGLGVGAGLRTMPVHCEEEIVAAIGAGAHAGFLSPIFPTDSHPGDAALGRERAVALAQASPLPLFALGGMDEDSAENLIGSPFQGFGAIGAFLEEPTL